MKTIMIIPALVCLGLAMFSCNKNYNCYCKEKLNDKDTVFIKPVKERNKAKAKTACENMSDSMGECSLNQ
jgi:hypothetical protein